MGGKVFRIFHIVGDYFAKKPSRKRGNKITMVEYEVLEQDGRKNLKLYKEFPIVLNWAMGSDDIVLMDLLWGHFSKFHPGKEIKIIRFW